MDVAHRAGAGWIEVVAGSMFSGKSEELIRRLRRAQIAKRKVQIFKPRIDDRYGDDHITSHSAMQIQAENVGSSRELLEKVRPDTEVVGIDEGQFFDPELPAVATTLADQGKRVIIAGLDPLVLARRPRWKHDERNEVISRWTREWPKRGRPRYDAPPAETAWPDAA